MSSGTESPEESRPRKKEAKADYISIIYQEM